MPISQSDATRARQDTKGLGPSSVVASSKGRPGPTPWRRMLASPAVWAIISNNFAFHYSFYVIMNWLPTYFNR